MSDEEYPGTTTKGISEGHLAYQLSNNMIDADEFRRLSYWPFLQFNELIVPDCFNMCQTEAFCWTIDPITGRPVLRPLVIIEDHRLVYKENIEKLLFDEVSSPEKTVGIPDCVTIGFLKEGDKTINLSDNTFKTKILLPWLKTSLSVLSAFAGQFRGKERENQMLHWLLKGVPATHSSLYKHIESCIKQGMGSFTQRIERLKLTLGLTPSFVEEMAVQRLKHAHLPTRGKDAFNLWEYVLDQLHVIQHHTLLGINQELKKIFHEFLRASPLIMESIRKGKDAVFVGLLHGEYINLTPDEASDFADYRRIALCIQSSHELWNRFFGPQKRLFSEAFTKEHKPESNYEPKVRMLRGKPAPNYNNKNSNKTSEEAKNSNKNKSVEKEASPPSSTDATPAKEQAPTGSSNKSPKLRKITNLLSEKDDNYSILHSYSKNELMVSAFIDPCNHNVTLFPYRLRKFCEEFCPQTVLIQAAGKKKNNIETMGEGYVTFMVPLHTGGSHRVRLKGKFMSEEDSIDDELIISRNHISDDPRISRGDQTDLTYSLLEDTEHIYGMDRWFIAEWTVIPVNQRVRRIRFADEEWKETAILEDFAQTIEVDIGELKGILTTERLLWKLHSRLGHPHQRSFELTLKAHGIVVKGPLLSLLYDGCKVCKNRPRPSKSFELDDNPARFCQQDLTEPKILGFGGNKYISVIIDYNGFISALPCTNKTEAAMHLINFLEDNPLITVVRVDGAKELNSENVKSGLIKRGVALEDTAPGVPQSTGRVERANRTIKEKMATMMIDLQFDLRAEFWPWFVQPATIAINSSVRSGEDSKMSPLAKRIEDFKDNSIECKSITVTDEYGFGDLVQFKAPTDEKKSREKNVTGFRLGLFLSTEHSGLVSLLGLQDERMVLWRIHQNHLSSASENHIAEFRRQLHYCLTNYDDKALQEIAVNNTGESTSIQIYSNPYYDTLVDFDLSDKDNTGETSDESESDSEESELEIKGKKGATPKKRRKAPKLTKRKAKRTRRIPTQRTFHTRHSLCVVHKDTLYVALSIPMHGTIQMFPVEMGKVNKQGVPMDVSVKQLLQLGRPALVFSSGRVLTQTVRRTGSGQYVQRFGYIAPDEAPLEDVNNGIFTEADIKEWDSIMENNVLGPVVTETKGIKPRRTRWRRTYKLTAQLERKPKSRFLVCEPATMYDPSLSTEVPQQWLRKLIVSYGLTNGWSAATVDIKTAFLLVPLPEDLPPIYVKLPAHLPQEIIKKGFQPGDIHKLERSLYGLQESPKLFNEYLANRLTELGWVQILPGLFTNEDERSYLIAYVDDLLCIGPDPVGELQKVGELLKCSDLLPVNDHSQRHVGLEITAANGSFFFDANEYIRSIPDFESEIDALGPEYAKSPLSPERNLPLFQDDDEEAFANFPPHHIHLYQRIIGTLNWISLCHPAVASRSGELAAATHMPTSKAFRVAKGVLREIKEQGLCPLEIVGVQTPEIRLWVDCAIHHHDGRRGWVLQLADATWELTDKRNLLSWRSAKDRMKHGSSTSGEVNAMQQTLEDTEDHLEVISKFLPHARLRILSDSQSGIQQVQNGGHTLKDRRRARYIQYLLQTSPLSTSGLEHVPGTIQLADPLTKPKNIRWFDHDLKIV